MSADHSNGQAAGRSLVGMSECVADDACVAVGTRTLGEHLVYDEARPKKLGFS
jgi:hypothetical protein